MADPIEALYKCSQDLGERGQAVQTRKEGVSTIKLATSIGRSNVQGKTLRCFRSVTVVQE